MSVVRVASADYTLVIAPDGRVLCQGRNQYGACGADLATAYVETLSPLPGVPRGRAVAVVDDGWASMLLGEDGRVYVWGKNDNGLFGGTDRGPTYVRPQPTALAGLERVIGIAAFVYGGAALRDDGTVRMWGEDREGLLAGPDGIWQPGNKLSIAGINERRWAAPAWA
jgi:alpha-tubulin suppressor-like RCC1 family protein